jgi:hypothetical protein
VDRSPGPVDSAVLLLRPGDVLLEDRGAGRHRSERVESPLFLLILVDQVLTVTVQLIT